MVVVHCCDNRGSRNTMRLLKVVKRDGVKESYRKWKYNYYMLETPENILRKELLSLFATTCGLLIATPFMFYSGRWYFSIVTLAGAWLSWLSFKTKKKQLITLEEIKKEFGGRE